MGTSTRGNVDREELAEKAPIVGGGLVAVALAVAAASFVAGGTTGFGARLPVYVFAGAAVFVGALLAMRYSPQEGTAVLRRSAVAGVLGFGGIALGTEAVVYSLIVVAPDLSVYLASVVLVACGLVYWSVRNWRAVDDLTRPW